MSEQIDVAVGVLVERDDQGWRVFITRRPAKVVYGGFWELPGGKVERGESVRDCLKREFLEEVGLEIEVGAALPEIEHQYAHGHVRLHPFFCRRIAGEPRNLHVSEHRWVRVDALDEYKFPEANVPLMARVREVLQKADSDDLVK